MPRSVASGRTAATNRVAVQDMKSSLMMTSSTSYVSLGAKTYLDGKPFTFYGWVKPTNYSARLFHYGFNYAGNAGYLVRLSASANIVLFTGTSSALSVGAGITPHQWVWLGVTYDGSSVVKFYKNGAYLSQTTMSPRVASGGTFLCAENTTGNAISTHKNQGIHDVVLTDTEMALAAQGIQQTRGQLGYYTYNEGSGTTAYDSSGNGNNGTITSGTFTSDVPTKKRGVVGGNLVYNGDFEYAPPFTAATTANSRFIDGTAGGNSSLDLHFKWRTNGASNNFTAQYDSVEKKSGSYSMKVSLTNAAGFAGITWGNQNTTSTMIPVLQNTSYTMSGWVKTTGVFPGAAKIDMIEYDGALGIPNVQSTTAVGGTTDWTFYTKTFTTGSTTRFIQPRAALGTGAVSSAWFDDIQLRPTAELKRTVSS